MGDNPELEAGSLLEYALAAKRLMRMHDQVALEIQSKNAVSSLTIRHFIEAGDTFVVEFGKLANLFLPLLDTEE